MKIDITTLDGGQAGSVELDDAIFGLEPRADILQRCVRWQLAKRRAGTHQTKGRSEIDRTTKKLYKQKGTGNARHGAASAPQFRGGGRAFGPVVRSHAHDLPKKVRALALKHALSAKARDATLIVVDEATLGEPRRRRSATRSASSGSAARSIIAGSRGRRQFRPRRPQPAQHRRAAGAGHQRLRHPAPRQARADRARRSMRWRRASNESRSAPLRRDR